MCRSSFKLRSFGSATFSQAPGFQHRTQSAQNVAGSSGRRQQRQRLASEPRQRSEWDFRDFRCLTLPGEDRTPPNVEGWPSSRKPGTLACWDRKHHPTKKGHTHTHTHTPGLPAKPAFSTVKAPNPPGPARRSARDLPRKPRKDVRLGPFEADAQPTSDREEPIQTCTTLSTEHVVDYSAHKAALFV